jgi:hypothetical protein
MTMMRPHDSWYPRCHFVATRRAGTTLMEVLVAIFIMGIGLLSLLVLFPLGALNMAQAIKDDRIALVSANAAALAEGRDIRNDFQLLGAGTDYFKDPSIGGNVVTPASDDGPSYAVLIDPIGSLSAPPANQFWVGDKGPLLQGSIPRRTVSFIGNNPQTMPALATQAFSLMDEIRFADTGSPDLTSGEVERDTGISFAYLMRRPRTADRSVVDVSIVIFVGRSVRATQDLAPPEYTYYTIGNSSVTYDNTRNVLVVTWDPNVGESAPPIKAGGWFLDGTLGHGFWYRATDVQEAGANTLEISVATPFKGFPANAQTSGVVMFLDGVAEVVEKNSGWQP